MAQVCPRCQRANPQAAVYCYFDGIVLRPGGLGPLPQAAQELAYPSGRRCRTLDDLVQACYTDWDHSRNLLVQGALAQFLGSVGRHDLARAAQSAQIMHDPDIGLHTLITSLPPPTNQGQLPHLDLKPRRLIVGPLTIGQHSDVTFTVANEGQGILQGKLAITDGQQWLKVVGGSSDRHLSLHVGRTQQVTLRIESRGLIAAQSYTGKVTAITNGGIAELAIRLDLAVVPFARAPYQGATSAQEMARRMLNNPKPAIDMLTSGEIARWFAANGWSYPIAGSAITGMAAVQQFFDALGLSKPPVLELSPGELRLRATVPQKLREQVTLRTNQRKLVYAQIESDAPWLKPVSQTATGQQQATIAFEVDSALMNDDALFVGNLRIIANANQTFSVRISVDVSGNPPRPATRPQAARPAAAPVPVAAAMNSPPTWEVPASVPVVRAAEAVQIPAQPPYAVPQPAPAPARPHKEAVQPGQDVHGFQWAPEPAPAKPARAAARASVPLWQPLVVGALLALIVRLMLLGPADLFARLLFTRLRSPAPGTLERWAQSPLADGSFLKVFVLCTWWVGAIVGVILVWQRGGRVVDLLAGAVAGAWGGLAGSATVGCVLALIDFVPRLVLKVVPASVSVPAPVATLLWLMLALTYWTALGAGVGTLLTFGGRRGAVAMAFLAAPLAWACRLVGLDRAAQFFMLEGK
jgi:hypothetical protein